MNSDPKDIPDVTIEKGVTCIENVVLNLEQGLCCRPSTLIIKECKQYGKKIYLVNQDEGGDGLDCSEMLNLVALDIRPGSKAKIRVEGVDEDARVEALRMYSGLTTTEFTPYFERFMEQR